MYTRWSKVSDIAKADVTGCISWNFLFQQPLRSTLITSPLQKSESQMMDLCDKQNSPFTFPQWRLMRDRLNGGTGSSLNTNELSAPGKRPARLLEYLEVFPNRFNSGRSSGLDMSEAVWTPSRRPSRVLYFSNWYKTRRNSLNLLVRWSAIDLLYNLTSVS